MASEKEIDDFLKKNEEWLNKNYIKAIDETILFTPLSDRTIYILGYPKIIRTFIDSDERVVESEAYLDIYTKNDCLENNEIILEKYLIEKRKKVYTSLLDKYLALTGLTINSLKIKKMERSYGRCYTVKKEIILSKSLIHKTMDFIEAIILHEIAHLKYPSHQKEFYEYIYKFMPDYKNKIKNFKVYWRRYSMEEEYKNNAGEIKTSVKAQWFTSVKKIRMGDFKIPEPRRIKPDDSDLNGFIDTPYPAVDPFGV